MNGIINVVLYCRISTEEQMLKGASLDEQERSMRASCEKNGYNVIACYKEYKSAKNFNRPQFIELMKFVKSQKGVVKYIMVFHWDRFSRDSIEASEILKKLSKLGVSVHTLSEGITKETSNYKLMRNINLALSEHDNNLKSERVTINMRAKALQGRTTHTAPKGYLNKRDDNDNKIVIIDPVLGSLVKNILEDFSTGEFTQVELTLKYEPLGLKLSVQTFNKMMRNRYYSGDIVVKSTEDEPEQIVNGLHEGLVSHATFDAIQNVLRGKRPTKNKVGESEEELPMKGLLVCDKCGKNLTGYPSSPRNTANGVKVYYYYKSETKICKCKININADIVHGDIEKLLNQLVPEPEIKKLIRTALSKSLRHGSQTKSNDVSDLKRKLDVVESNKTKLTELRMNEEIDGDEFKLMKSKYEDERLDIVGTLSKYEHEFKDIDKYIDSSFEFFDNLGRLYNRGDYKFKRKLISSILSGKIKISEKKYRTISLNNLAELMYSNNKELRRMKNKKSDSSLEESLLVTPRIFISNEIYEQMKNIHHLMKRIKQEQGF